MTTLQFTFYFFAALTVLSAVGVITVRNPVRAALFLVLTFVSAAGVWMTTEAEFLAITLVLVYVGAVMVLFLFVVMMLDVDMAAMQSGFVRHLPFGLAIAVVLVVELALVMTGTFDNASFPNPALQEAGYSNTKVLGLVIYTDYVLAFEVAALILLVAMIAAISLTMRPRRKGLKTSNPGDQVKVKKEDRLQIVDLRSPSKSSEAGGRS